MTLTSPLWRISDSPDLSGVSAEFASARWHTRAEGKRIVYLAEHPSLALIETLVNLRNNLGTYPDSFQLLKVVAGQASSLDLTSRELSGIDPHDLATTQFIGDAWLEAKTSALLRVPSAPAPESWNYLLNPLHPDASLLHIDWAQRITYDRRLFHLSK